MIRKSVKWSAMMNYLSGHHQYHFSSDPQMEKKENDKKASKNRLKIFQTIPVTEIKNSRDSKMVGLYLKKLGEKYHFRNSPYLLKMKNTNKVLYSMLQFKQHLSKQFQWKSQKETSEVSQKILLISTIIMSIISYLFFLTKIFGKDKRKKNERIVLQEQYVKGTQNFEKTLANMQKIYIYGKKNVRVSEHEDMRTSSYEPKSQQKLLIHYKIVLEDKEGNKYTAEPYIGDPNNLLKYIEKIQKKYMVSNKIEVIYQKQQVYTFRDAFFDSLGFLTPFIPLLITVFIFRSTDPTNFLSKIGKNAKQFKVQALKDIKTKFKDVAGMEQAKKQITEFVDFLKNNERYKEIGAKIPKGALLTGPPGTGKTMLARACAGQSGVSFFYISGSEFVQIFVGLGASKVRQLFAKAREQAPSIIFIDEIDAIGKKRESSRNQQKDSTLNQLLVEMDGFSSHETVVVLAATNRKQMLDNALTRPGRFDRIVEITLPDIRARQQIFKVHLSPLKLDPNQKIETIAQRLSEISPGFSGADIANLCNQAAIIATRNNREYIVDKDFEEASERITAGYVKKNLLKQKTKKRVAYHQAGHAVSSWFLKGGKPLLKLTIIPRSKGALGYAQYLPKTSYLMEKQQIIDRVAILLSGITSEIMFFGDMSSGGSDDLQKVYSLTRTMVTQYGMGKDTYNLTLDESSYIQKQSIFLSDKMQQQISSILEEGRNKSRSILQAKKDFIQILAKQLMAKQTINKVDIEKILGTRPDFGIHNEKLAANQNQ